MEGSAAVACWGLMQLCCSLRAANSGGSRVTDLEFVSASLRLSQPFWLVLRLVMESSSADSKATAGPSCLLSPE